MNLLCTPGTSTCRRYTPGRGCTCTQATMSSSRPQASASSSARSGRLASQSSNAGWRRRVRSSSAPKRLASRRLPISARASSRLSTQASCGTALVPNRRCLNSRNSTRQYAIACSSPIHARSSLKRSLISAEVGPLSSRRRGKSDSPATRLASSSPRSHSFCTWARRPAGRVQLIQPPAPSRRGTPRSTDCAASRYGLPRCARSRRWRRRVR